MKGIGRAVSQLSEYQSDQGTPVVCGKASFDAEAITWSDMGRRIQRHAGSKGLFMVSMGLFMVLLYVNFYGLWKTDNSWRHEDDLTERHVTPLYSIGQGLHPLLDEPKATEGDIRSRSNLIGGKNMTYIPRRSLSEGGDPAATPTIPHIIHQTWDTENIPVSFQDWIKTWVALHPTWEYWLWTQADAKKLVTEHYGEHLTLYESYTKDIYRSDVMRYFVLHKYGGVYLDLDMEALKPMDNITFGYQFVLSEETYEHPYIVREATGPANILNGFLAGRPGHPLLALAISLLEKYAGMYFGDYLHATGPFFLEEVLRCYRKDPKWQTNAGDVTILPPRFFFPTFDPSESEIIANKCFPKAMGRLPPEGQMTCRELYATFFKRFPLPESYADHHWVHAYMLDDEWKARSTVPLRSLVPNAKDLSTVL